MMESTIHKWVLIAMAAPNPTPSSKSGKHIVKTAKIELGPKLVRNRVPCLRAIFLNNEDTYHPPSYQPIDREKTLRRNQKRTNMEPKSMPQVIKYRCRNRKRKILLK